MRPIALYLVYRKTAETPAEVTYRFGNSETTLDRELTIRKEDEAVTAGDGRSDPLLTKVAARILTRHTTDRNWPGGGGIQA